MEVTSKPEPYVVWTSDNEAERFPADLVVSMLDKVLFFLNGKQVKEYAKQKFIRYNPRWKSLENIE